MSQITGAGFASGAVGAGLNEAVIGEIKKIKDPGTAQIVSAIVGAAVAKAIGGNAAAGATSATSGTKWNYLAEGHNPVQIGISIKPGLLGHVGIVVKTDMGTYDSADYGRYGFDVDQISGLEAPVGQGTVITRWSYDPEGKYTYMLNPQYIDPIKTVKAYNDWIMSNGYTQIPMDQAPNHFNEAKNNDTNKNTQYYRNANPYDYNLIFNNCTTTTLRAILIGSSASAGSAAFETLIDLNGEISPAQLMIALNHDIAIHHGKGLVVEKSDWEALPE